MLCLSTFECESYFLKKSSIRAENARCSDRSLISGSMQSNTDLSKHTFPLLVHILKDNQFWYIRTHFPYAVSVHVLLPLGHTRKLLVSLGIPASGLIR